MTFPNILGVDGPNGTYGEALYGEVCFGGRGCCQAPLLEAISAAFHPVRADLGAQDALVGGREWSWF